MARQSFKFFTPRDKPNKRGARQHKKIKISQKNVKKNRLVTKDRVDIILKYPTL